MEACYTNQTAISTAELHGELGDDADEEFDGVELGPVLDGKLDGEILCEPDGELDGEEPHGERGGDVDVELNGE